MPALRSDRTSTLLLWLLRACGVLTLIGAAGMLWVAGARAFSATVAPPSPFLRAAIIILVSGGIGFGTNWLAIKMLFRPRRRVPWLVVWNQGLLPREQQRFAHALGEVAARRLLNPDAIVEGLNDERLRVPLGEALRDELEAMLAEPAARELLATIITDGIRQHGGEVVHQLRPRLRQWLEQAIDEQITSEKMLGWLRQGVYAFAANQKMRRILARWIADQTSSEGALKRIMAVVEEQFHQYRERHPVKGFFAEQFMIDWNDVRDSLQEVLRSEDATNEFAEILLEAAGSIMERLYDPQTADMVANLRRQVVDHVLDWFEADGIVLLADRLREAADAPQTWRLVEHAIDDLAHRVPDALFEPESGQLRPPVRERLENLQRRLVEAFPIAEIVERQVLAMDPAAIERMVDEIGRHELAWIQILGFILGIVAGAGLLALV